MTLRLRQRKSSRRTVQQARLQMRFQFPHLAADRCQRHAKTPRGGRQAARINDSDEDGHGFKAIHGSSQIMEG